MTTIDLKYLLIGTPFQNKVWEEILKIPYGETRTYSDIATAIGNPKGYRAVANTCGENKLALIVPCHRVVGKNNYIGGYKWGVDKKAWLLKFEALNKQKMSVDMLQAITWMSKACNKQKIDLFILNIVYIM